MADTADLSSAELKTREGSNPSFGTIKKGFKMEFEVRKVSDEYVSVEMSHDDTLLELGLFNREESKELAMTLFGAICDLSNPASEWDHWVLEILRECNFYDYLVRGT